ncbi:claudin-17 [Xyrauchen texanus]|uniref:claudin-17 n=1 Tax=Xyrauchen texanus TaxID=154827 RepID=UPI002241CA3F|nr:claudin-17 [Xyrauchen texanus]
MVHGKCELIALCLGIVGLTGTAMITGLPMWKVTAFIGENIIVMETRWEGLWMTCFRQASIHMQCKVYDSLLFLPPDLQAARGLTCCALALSTLGLLVSIMGLSSTACLKDQPRIKRMIVMVAGAMQIMASLCVNIPVSWTAHTIIRDFYNPLLIDAQRRELGEALYIGWVTSILLLASGVIFLCRCAGPQSASFYEYPPDHTGNNPTLNRFHPFSSTFSSAEQQPQPLLQNNSLSPSVCSFATMPPVGQCSLYTGEQMIRRPIVYNQNMLPSYNPHTFGSNIMQNQYVPINTQDPSQRSTHFTGSNDSNPYSSYTSGSAFQPVPQNPLFVGYNFSRLQSYSSNSSAGLRI